MSKKIGFIGCGNMGSAMVSGIIKSGIIKENEIIVSTKSEESAKRVRESLKIEATLDNREVAEKSEIIVLAVKPYMYKDIIENIKDKLTKDKLIITIAAGISLKNMEEFISKDVMVIRTMPNTPASVEESMSALCPNKNVTEEELNKAVKIFESFGECVQIEEKDFHAFTALCGSSPAYVYMFIEAMADAGVKLGIQRSKAYKMAAQAVLGSAKMVLETGKHPGELKDAVCSPGGTTIDAVCELEKLGFRNAAMQAVIKCAEKSMNM
ncbi:pyrroline-5-carboxylate reductase [Clostridium sp. BJN0001]|uniref:pyrroline-5-carboxylate reductase n=1 Tax=Clostridium sp. BJN0001 TaxID=2930219 RepID=UPI001FD0CAD4|nr:pyrroline-5-carboxylate reductase [Clostridium sp. BJN0001]